MRLLKDDELKDLYGGTTPIIAGIAAPKDWTDARSPVQPSSIDLHIGKISVPGHRSTHAPTEIFHGRHPLPSGQTAVVTTLETLHMLPDLAAIGFPPSHVSVQGILMTNPGHVDPGYKGPMHLTLINMGREPFELRIGDPIVTVLFFRLDSAVSADYTVRNPGTLADPDVNKLSRDFVDVENRAKKIATGAVRRGIAIVTVLAAVITVAAQAIPYYLGGIEEAKRNDAVLSQQVKALEEKVKSLEEKQQPTAGSAQFAGPKTNSGKMRSK
jgi:dCTP deaminase